MLKFIKKEPLLFGKYGTVTYFYFLAERRRSSVPFRFVEIESRGVCLIEGVIVASSRSIDREVTPAKGLSAWRGHLTMGRRDLL